VVERRSFIAALAGGLWASRPWADVRAAAGLQEAARDAWLFVLPLIELAALRARPALNDGKPAPINVLRHGRSLAGPKKSRAVTTPNNDTLYSTAFVDTTKGPVRLEVPDCNGRYLSVQITDMYTNNNFILSPRAPGRAPGAWRLLSPDSDPRDARELRLATPHAWLTVRILVEGQADLPAVHAIQDRVGLEGPAFPPPSSAATRTSDWPAYFAAAQQLLESDPPPFKNGLDAFIRVRDAVVEAISRVQAMLPRLPRRLTPASLKRRRLETRCACVSVLLMVGLTLVRTWAISATILSSGRSSLWSVSAR